MKLQTKQTIRIYMQHAKAYRRLGWLAMLFVVLASSVNMATPLLYKQFFDVLSNGNVSALYPLLAWIGLFLLLNQIFWRLSAWCVIHFSGNIMRDLANTCFQYLHRHSFAFFNNSFVGSLVKQSNYFVRAFEVIVDRLVFDMLQLVVNLCVIMVVLYERDIRLGAIVSIWTGLFMLVNWKLTNYKLPFDVKRSASESTATALLADTITNNANVKLFVGYKREVSAYDKAVNVVRQLRIFTWKLDVLYDTVQGILAAVLEIGIFYVAIRLYAAHRVTVGDFVLIQAYVLNLFDRLWGFSRQVRSIYENLADAEDMTAILTTSHEVVDVPGAKTLDVTAAAIRFKRVQFNYNETRTVLDKFQLDIQSHEKVALVGPSGAGKSTIVKLLLRQHDVTDGHIFIDNQDIAKVSQESLWEAISLVPQEPLLFHRTLMENIRYGKPNATDDEVIRAATLAHCHGFISSFPQGYETYVGERGVKLSGGERQRVAIARAILRNAPILILDEATSSLDSESEGLIQSALETLMKGKTVIVIAHRLSTIMKMDRIVVIDGGQIREDGSHAELLEKESGLYKKLWQLQAGGFVSP